MPEEIESLSLSCRVVLLSVTQLEQTGETPVHTGQVIQATKNHVDAVDADTLGSLDEAEVNRALNRLEADSLVEMAELNNSSPVGKGRPAYSLDVSAEVVLETLSADEAVASLADQIRAGS
jgi:Cdc6-like AAA superfamily ATPase